MLRMNQIDQIKELQRQGLGPQEIAGRLNLNRKTVAKYMEVLRGIRRAICFYPRSAQPVLKVCRLGSTEKELLTALDLKIGPVR